MDMTAYEQAANKRFLDSINGPTMLQRLDERFPRHTCAERPRTAAEIEAADLERRLAGAMAVLRGEAEADYGDRDD